MSDTFGNYFGFSMRTWGAFAECPRRLWLSKSLFWRGWEKTAAKSKRLAYALTKMQTVYSLAGEIVHEICADVVKHKLERTPEQAEEHFRDLFHSAIRESLSGAWRQDPKNKTFLFEHYYRMNQDDLDDRIGAAEFSGRASAYNLMISDTLARIRSGKVLSVENIDKVDLEGVPTWVTLDVETKYPGGVIEITDWKTGKKKELDRVQALTYALTRILSGVPRKKIMLTISYLRYKEEVRFRPTPEDIDNCLRFVTESANAIRSLLNPPGDLFFGPPENFPRTRSERTCSMCHMYHACKKTRVIPGITHSRKGESK